MIQQLPVFKQCIQVCDFLSQAPQSWPGEVQQQLLKMGHMAFKMLERRSREFSEDNLEEIDLGLQAVTVFSGLCTELLPASRGRTFCFQHYTFQVKLILLLCFIWSLSHRGFLMVNRAGNHRGQCAALCLCCVDSVLLFVLLQEFMAALYILATFHCDSINVLETGSSSKFSRMLPAKKPPTAASLLRCALERTLAASSGHYNLLLRFLCGLLSPDCHHSQLSGFLFPRQMSKINGLQEARRLLEGAVTKPQTRDREQLENLQECLQEMVLEEL